MRVRYRIDLITVLKMAIVGGAGLFCLVSFWARPSIRGLATTLHHNLLIGFVSFTAAVAVQVIFIPIVYVGIGVLVFNRTRRGMYEGWSKLGLARGRKLQRIALRLSGREVQLRLEHPALVLLETSPPPVGSVVEASFGPLGILLRLRW